MTDKQPAPPPPPPKEPVRNPGGFWEKPQRIHQGGISPKK